MDSLCLRTGIHGIGPSIPISSSLDIRTNPSQLTTAGRTGAGTAAAASANAVSVEKSSDKTLQSRFSFKYPFRSLFPGGRQRIKGLALDDAVLVDGKERQEGRFKGRNEEEGFSNLGESEGQNGNWVMKILHVKSLWSEQGKNGEEGDGGDDDGTDLEGRENEGNDELGDQKREDSSSSSSSCNCDCEENGVCRACDNDDENVVVYDRDSFSKLLKKVSLAEAKLYAQMSSLGSLAYSIPSIKPGNLLKRHGLRYVTSSIEKREYLALASTDKKEQSGNSKKEKPLTDTEATEKRETDLLESEEKNEGYRISASAAFQIAASAASYLHTRTRSILPFRSSRNNHEQVASQGGSEGIEDIGISSEMASFMATTDSVTAVVAAKEEVKQAVADDLNSISSSPCEWYICDDDQSATRFFVIQGSETLASWQANLLFEPIQFEGLDVFVHRGIYEAAKGMYQQMLPEVHAHMKARGRHAKFRFTGHSLGGSLSLLLNLMLLIRGEVPPSSLLPIITFGSPCVMCGGDDLLRRLRLPKSHVRAITMHRDIVPRAFSCNYPGHVAELLKALNGNFRNHPCLNNQKLLYAPMGDLIILQPDASFSPQHDLLPSGSGLYLLSSAAADAEEAEKQVQAAKNVFLNTPHPLEILSDRSAYGNGGSIQRDHDMNSYLKCVRGVIRQELNRIRKAKREHRRKVWWPLVASRVINTVVTVGNPMGSRNAGQGQFTFSGIVRTGSESLKRFSRLVASQHMHLFFVLLFPARLLLIGTLSTIGFR
ncbi:hypothetical protein Ancab_022471 [Ancistrocladus abbreviatus]